MSMDFSISEVVRKLNMTHIKTQLDSAMLEGKMNLVFNRRDDRDPMQSLPTGDMHLMQAVALARQGWTVERSAGTFTVSGWANNIIL